MKTDDQILFETIHNKSGARTGGDRLVCSDPSIHPPSKDPTPSQPIAITEFLKEKDGEGSPTTQTFYLFKTSDAGIQKKKNKNF